MRSSAQTVPIPLGLCDGGAPLQLVLTAVNQAVLVVKGSPAVRSVVHCQDTAGKTRAFSQVPADSKVRYWGRQEGVGQNDRVMRKAEQGGNKSRGGVAHHYFQPFLGITDRLILAVHFFCSSSFIRYDWF